MLIASSVYLFPMKEHHVIGVPYPRANAFTAVARMRHARRAHFSMIIDFFDALCSLLCMLLVTVMLNGSFKHSICRKTGIIIL